MFLEAGVGFIVFKDAASVEKVLEQKEHRLPGRVADPKKAMAMEKDPVKKIEKVREYFGEFGEIEAIELPKDPKSNKRRGFVSVAFKEEGPVKKVLEKRSRTISGSKCAIQGAHAEGCAQPRAALGAVGTAAQDPAAALGRGGGQSPGTGNQGDGHPRGSKHNYTEFWKEQRK
uniref:RRM domain-containing protein n=1 Tax=Canis lupus familiaris TaxID=9615 RepID=A0A8C0N1G9_CANLF